jgi:hypothetical protein
VAQKAAILGYVHRNLKSIEGVSNLNAKGYKNLKEAVLVPVNQNKPLEASKKFEKLHAGDLEKAESFIKDTQNRIHDSTFKFREYIDSRGSRVFSLLS